MTPPVRIPLTPEARYRLDERLAIDLDGRKPTPFQWEHAALCAAYKYNTPGEPTILTEGPKSVIQEGE